MNMHPALKKDYAPQPVVTVPCPRCDSEMIAAVREPLASQLKAQPGSPSTPKIRLTVWRCITCGVESPRFG